MRYPGLAVFGIALSVVVRARATEHRGESDSIHDSAGILFGGGAVSSLRSSLSIDGRDVAPIGGFALDLEAGYSRRFGRIPLAVGAMLRGGSFQDQWSSAVNEERSRLDFRALFEASWMFARRAEQPCFTVSVGGGPTVAWIDPQEHQAVLERYHRAVGLHGALRIGMRLRVSRYYLLYYAVESSIHRVSTDRTASVRAEPAQASRERYRFQDTSLGVTLGNALSL